MVIIHVIIILSLLFSLCHDHPQHYYPQMTADLKKDPAIEKWAAMREHTHFYYRFNFKKLIPTAIMLGLIPFGLVYFSLKSFVRRIEIGESGMLILFFCFCCRIIMKS